METELRCNKLVKRYDGRAVVNGVDMEVHGGEIVGLLGPNGAGKTTSFLMIVGLIRPDEGTVVLNESDVTGMAMYRRARQGIGYLPQEPSVFRNLTVRENFLAILELVEDDKERRYERCESLLNEFDLKHVRETKGRSLSGGERRRVEIGRALIPDPDFILLDEPFAGVDPIAVGEVQDIVSMLKERGLGVLITDHNVRETLKITDRSYIMNEGKILISGDAETLVQNEEARQIYLGDSFSMPEEGERINA
ncbi:MAG: LPS export ABC transporter ATP-binding protein [bacterium]